MQKRPIKMKKNIISCLFLCFCFYFCVAQPPKRAARLEAIKVAFVTNALNLTEEEAQKFWPVFNKYTAEIKAARQANKEDELQKEEEVLAIRKKYKPEFKKILNDDARVNKIYSLEKDFINMLQKELKKRQELRKKQPTTVE
jgi:hypothetical protein